MNHTAIAARKGSNPAMAEAKTPYPPARAQTENSLRQRLRNRLSRDHIGYIMLVLAFVIGLTVFLSLGKVSDISTQSNRLSAVIFVAILLLLTLAFFVGRQLLRLWHERKQRLAGAQLHLRLVMLFGLITAIPSILVALFAVSLIDYSLRGWFADRISTAVNESVEVASAYFEEHARSVRGQILTMANDINREAPRLVNNQKLLNEYLSNQTVLRNLSESVIVDGAGRIKAKSQFAFAISFSKIDGVLLDQAREGDVIIITPEDNNKIQAIVKLNSFVDAYLMVGRFVDANVLSALDRTQLAVNEYQSLGLRQFDLQISFAVMFFVVALLLVLSALWIGLTLANSIVEPLVSIIGVAEQVRSGNLKQRVPEIDNMDEIARLGISFNGMLDEVSNSREQLVEANKQLDARREFTEAVLGGVTSGVIGLDKKGIITLPNQAACTLLDRELEGLIGQKLIDIQPEFKPIFDQLSIQRRAQCEQQIILRGRGRTQTLRVRLVSERVEGRLVGYVLTFDDITDFLAAQRKAAWADVARRIAHEIKNPLTPIALATDRLMKKYRPEDTEEGKKFDEYMTIISRQVGDIGRMVEEFSKFARMPAPVLKKTDLCRLVQEQQTLLQTYTNLDLVFDLPEDAAPIWVQADAGLMRQMLTNLMKNAIENMQETQTGQSKDGAQNLRIEVAVAQEAENAIITIRDYGSGFAGEDVERYLEPYVTTRNKGTGLGLAIAQKIISDHDGQIFLSNHHEQGAIVKLTLPCNPENNDA
ncbi:MAG: ATP-binding protein [Candidatus Puniceispirillaceae bacterium]